MNRLAKLPAGGGGGSKQTTGYPRTLLENKLNERYFELESKLKKDVQGRYHIVYPHPPIHPPIHPLMTPSSLTPPNPFTKSLLYYKPILFVHTPSFSTLPHHSYSLTLPTFPHHSLPLSPGGGPSFVARVAEQFEARCKEMHQEVCVAYDQICENALKTAERQGLPLLQGMSLSR